MVHRLTNMSDFVGRVNSRAAGETEECGGKGNPCQQTQNGHSEGSDMISNLSSLLLLFYPPCPLLIAIFFGLLPCTHSSIFYLSVSYFLSSILSLVRVL